MSTERIKYISFESALPCHQLAFVTHNIVRVPHWVDGTLGDEYKYASLLYAAYEKVNEHDMLSTSIIGAMLHSSISNPMLQMGIYESIGSDTNTMYPNGVVFITYTEKNLMMLFKDRVEYIIAKQNSMRDSLMHLKQDFMEINYHASDLTDKINEYVNRIYGWDNA